MRTLRALGATVRVDLGDLDPAEFDRAWARCLVADEDADPESETVGPVSSMVTLTQRITHALIGRRRGELLMLHAGAVCNPTTGAAIAYVAPGGTGKTTLTRLLGQSYGYITDETVGVEPGSWRIHPYQKPLSLRTPEGGYPKSEVGPDELRLIEPHPDPTLTTLVLLRRSPDHQEATMTRLDVFDAITSLVPETSSLSRLSKPLHLLDDLYADLDGIWLLEFSEAEQLAPWIADRLGEP